MARMVPAAARIIRTVYADNPCLIPLPGLARIMRAGAGTIRAIRTQNPLTAFPQNP